MGVTRNRRPLLVLLTAAAVAFGAAACGPKAGEPTANATTLPATPSATVTTDPTVSPTPTSTATQPPQFTTDGAGPYRLGRTKDQLQAAGLDQVAPAEECPANTSARGTGVWQDVYLYFRPDGKLYLLRNRSLSIPTPSGVYLGTTREQLKTIYASLVVSELSHGGTNAVLVQTLAGSGILFELNDNDQVTSMYAASQAFYLRNTFSAGDPFC